MATIAQSLPESSRPLGRFREFLKEELAPYPGRAALVARMTLAATLVMIICMTFRIPYGFQGAIYALLISRESPRVTLRSAGIIFIFTGIGAAYVLISARFVINDPLLHFLWIIGSFFLVFYALRVMSISGAAAIFAIMISVGVPLWDRHVSAETNVEDMLRVLLAASIGVVVTAAVELAFARMKPGDDIVLPIAERLAAVENLLGCYAADRPVDDATEKKIFRLEILGSSTLRRSLRRSDYSSQYRAQMGGVIALVGRLVDIAATLTQLSFKSSDNAQKQLRALATTVANIRTNLVKRRVPSLIEFNPDHEPQGGVPFLGEMEKTVTLIPQAFEGSRSIEEYLPPSDDMPGSKLVVPDALDNPEHFKFALKGCLAASLCYIIYNSLAWPGISTAVTTCLLTGLSTIGSSRQKQILRFAGAVVGGFLIGMGSQIFILPYLDSIAGFTLLFILVTGLASWFITSSPRLSYFGLQVALAFYLINLQEFAAQTSLSIARDRVVGVLLGLFMMWLVFEHLWGASAAVEMKRMFISILRLLAQYLREPLSKDLKVAAERSYSLRETIGNNFDQVRALADGVLFEFGDSRQEVLALRSRIVSWTPQLRMLFLTQVALWKYRVQLPGFELPKPVAAAHREFDERLAEVLDGMADRMEGRASEGDKNFRSSVGSLDRTIQSYYSGMSNELVTGQFGAFLSLSHRIEDLTLSLDTEIQRKI
jgi:multidrug resistance protein MdtO